MKEITSLNFYVRSEKIRPTWKTDGIGINRKICQARPVLSSPEKRCQHFSRKILLPIHKSAISCNSDILSFILIELFETYPRETISSTFFKQKFYSHVISSKSEYKIAPEACSEDTFRSRDVRDLRSGWRFKNFREMTF